MKLVLSECINRVKENDSDALVDLYHQYKPIVFVLMNKYRIQEFDRNDWLQEGLICCYLSASSYEADKGISFGYYFKLNFIRRIFSVLRSQYAKKRNESQPVESLDSYLETHYELPVVFLKRSQNLVLENQLILKDELEATLEQFSPFELDVFVKCLEGKENEDIGSELECSVKQVKNAFDRISQKTKIYRM